MTELPRYVIVGRGRWASRMTAILAGENRRVASLEQSRRAPSEDDSSIASGFDRFSKPAAHRLRGFVFRRAIIFRS